VDVVSIGTRVRATDTSTQHAEMYEILGAWDSDPEKGIISYLTPVAQAFINHKVGEEVELESDGHKRKLRIDSIEAIKAA
jgi:transcription elongation GreA/GreB family factor